jgi:hypothetical protein
MAIFHLTAKTASRSGGQSAQAHFEYIARTGKYSNKARDRLIFFESKNMPAWACLDSKSYWQAADQFERANGRLYKSVEFALPSELSERENIKLAKNFVEKITTTSDGKLPFSLAVHEGRGHNPHVHLMISERALDQHNRSPESWFKRAATGKKMLSEGGAKKTDLLKPKEWLLMVRELWSSLTNKALESNKKASRVDHRSHKTRGINTPPSAHAGPHKFKYKRRSNTPRHTDHSTRERQLEIIQTTRELDALKRLEVAKARLRDKPPAPSRPALARKPQPFNPEI